MPSFSSARRRAAPLAALLLVSALASMGTLTSADAHEDVHANVDSFKASVEHAEADMQAMHDKKDVVDLGASLRIVEERFAALRSSLLTEMGADTAKTSEADGGKAADLQRHARELTAKGGEMIRKLGASRAQVHAVLAEVRIMDGATGELREAVGKLEKEIGDLGSVIGQAHTDNNVLFAAHEELRSSVKEVNWRAAALPEASQRLRGLHVPKWYYVVFAEFIVLVLFGAYKVYTLRKKDKFSKLG